MASLMTYSEREVSFLDRYDLLFTITLSFQTRFWPNSLYAVYFRGDDKYMISRQPKLSLGCRVRLQIKDVLYRWRFELGGKARLVSQSYVD
jgi:hypothetical protein